MALAQSGKIRRSTQTSPYFYYLVAHKEPLRRIAINWARMWLDSKCKSWERTSFDYNTSTCTVINTVTGVGKEYHITDKVFKLPGDNRITINDDFINHAKEDLKCLKCL